MRRLLPLLLFTAAASLAYTPVQVGPAGCKNGTGSLISTVLTCSFTSDISANSVGNVLVVGIHMRLGGTASGIASITDTLGTSYNLLKQSHDAASGVWLYAGNAPPAGGANMVTVTMSGGTPATYFFSWLTLLEYRGDQLTATAAGTSGATTSSAVNTTPCGAFTPSQANTQVIAAIYNNQANNYTLTPDSPMTAQRHNWDGTDRQSQIQDYFMATATSINPSATQGAGGTALYSCAAAALSSATPDSQVIVSGTRVRVGPDFSFVFIADQHPTAAGVPWVDNAAYVVSKQVPWNIKGVFFSGDILARGETQATFWTHGWNNILGMAVPAIAAPGNHDCDADAAGCTTRITNLFDVNEGYDRVSSASWGPVNAFTQTENDLGHFVDPGPSTSRSNFAIRFSVNGHKFLVIALEVFPRVSVMTWAANLAGVYTDHKVIYITHAFIDDLFALPCTASIPYCAGSGGLYNSYEDSTTGLILYNTLIKPLANSFLVFSGHFPDYVSQKRYSSTGTNGNAINSFMYDHQSNLGNANDTVMRILFHEATKTFDVFLMSRTSDTAVASWTGIAWPQ